MAAPRTTSRQRQRSLFPTTSRPLLAPCARSAAHCMQAQPQPGAPPIGSEGVPQRAACRQVGPPFQDQLLCRPQPLRRRLAVEQRLQPLRAQVQRAGQRKAEQLAPLVLRHLAQRVCGGRGRAGQAGARGTGRSAAHAGHLLGRSRALAPATAPSPQPQAAHPSTRIPWFAPPWCPHPPAALPAAPSALAWGPRLPPWARPRAPPRRGSTAALRGRRSRCLPR